MIFLYTAKEVREAEKRMTENGMDECSMIRRAASGAAELILPILKKQKEPRVILFCGGGNNGADGYELCRLLNESGVRADAFAVDTGNQTEENRRFAAGASEYILDGVPDLSRYTLAVDAIFGVGFHGRLPQNVRRISEALVASGVFVAAIDLPSGVDASTGEADECAVKANVTVQTGCRKIGAYVYPGAGFAGQTLLTAEWQMPESAVSLNCGFPLPARPDRSHKGTFGTVGIVAGSKNMAGTAYLAASAAYTCGAGLVKIVTPEDNRTILQTLLPEAVLFTYTEKTPLCEILSAIGSCTSLALGPGLGKSAFSRDLVCSVLSNCRMPLVLDADGLNLAAGTGLIADYSGKIVITPHAGEAARLTGIGVKEITEHPLFSVRALLKTGAHAAVFKDAHTLCATADRTVVNLTGNSGMACGGSGDVLTGICAQMLFEYADPLTAVCEAVFLHGAAGDLAAKKYGKRPLNASRIIEGLSEIIKEKENETIDR